MKLVVAMTLCLMTSLSPKSLAATPSEPNICFKRSEIQPYKVECELTKAKLAQTQSELDMALADPPEALSFYQEPGFVAGHAFVTFVLIFLAAQK